jgi:hypothetical protein
MLIMLPSQPEKIYHAGQFVITPKSLGDLKKADLISRFAIEEIIILNPMNYVDFIQTIGSPHSIHKGMGGYCSTNLTMDHLRHEMSEWDEKMHQEFVNGAFINTQAIFKGLVGKDYLYVDYQSGILVDPQGGDTAHHVMLLSRFDGKDEVVKDIQLDVRNRFTKKKLYPTQPARFFKK